MTQVTVGIPVYNGAGSIAEALDNLLRQSLCDIRILVSDNASTDGTAEIVEAAAREDSRITLIRQAENIGPVGNFRSLAERAETPFFAWRAHDDLTDDDFFEVLLARMEATPSAALIAPKTITRRPYKDRERPFALRLPDGAAADWRQMVRAEAGWFYGLHRTDAARAGVAFAHTHYPHVWGWDYLPILNALLSGGVAGTNGTRFYHRLLAPAGGRYDYSRAELRRIYLDFVKAGEALGDAHGQSGIARARYRMHLARLAGRRVVRWSRMLF